MKKCTFLVPYGSKITSQKEKNKNKTKTKQTFGENCHGVLNDFQDFYLLHPLFSEHVFLKVRRVLAT